MLWPAPKPPLFPYTTLFRSDRAHGTPGQADARSVDTTHTRGRGRRRHTVTRRARGRGESPHLQGVPKDRKSTRLNSSHVKISYAVFCLKKKKLDNIETPRN